MIDINITGMLKDNSMMVYQVYFDLVKDGKTIVSASTNLLPTEGEFIDYYQLNKDIVKQWLLETNFVSNLIENYSDATDEDNTIELPWSNNES